MAQQTPTGTISMRERSYPAIGAQERLPKWLVFSLVLHAALIAALFLTPMLPTETRPVPVYTVDLVGGERIGRANFGTELTSAPKRPVKDPEVDRKEAKKEEPKIEKVKPKAAEPKPPVEEKIVLKEKTKAEPVRNETAKNQPVKEVKAEAKEESKSETASAESVRERLIQSAVDRAEGRSESVASKGEVLSAGSGEGDGAAALGAGGRGGPGIVKGIDFIIYQNRMLATIKENWAWVGQRSNLRVVVQFGVKENGEIVGLKIVQPSGDPSYDESVLRAVKKSSPLPAPPENYRKDFADVELTFRPRDLGA